MTGSSLGFLILSSVLVVAVVLLRPGILLLWILRKFFQVLLIPMSTFLLPKPPNLSTLLIVVSWIGCCLVLGFLVGFVMLILSTMLMSGYVLKLASGLGQSWTRDGGIRQGFPLSMMFIVALYLPWCRYLSAQVGVRPQLYADNLKCLSGNPDLLLHAARFTMLLGYVRLVGQEPAPSKCVLLSTSRVVRKDMKDWVLSCEGDQWSVKFDVRDLGFGNLLGFLRERGFGEVEFADFQGSLQLLTSSHQRERDKMLLRAILCGGVWNGFLLGKAKKEDVPCRFSGKRDGDGHLFWECTFSPLKHVRDLPEFAFLMSLDRSNWPRLSALAWLVAWS